MIKLFNEYKSWWEEHNVEEVTAEDYNRRLLSKWESFTQDELDKLGKVIESRSKDGIYHINNGKYGLYFEHKTPGVTICIEKYEDEWYYVNILNYISKDSFYKCDQFDSLLEFIKVS